MQSQMPQCRPVRAAHHLPTELPLCFEARFLGWCTNNLNLAPMVMVGAKQLGYLRARLRRKKPCCDLCRLHEAIAHGTGDPRTSTSTAAVHRTSAGRDAAMVSARLPLHWHVNRRSSSTVAGRVASAAQRKRTQTDSAARAPRTVRSDSTNVVSLLVQDELQAWPARRAMLICAARSCTDAVRVAIRPSTFDR